MKACQLELRRRARYKVLVTQVVRRTSCRAVAWTCGTSTKPTESANRSEIRCRCRWRLRCALLQKHRKPAISPAGSCHRAHLAHHSALPCMLDPNALRVVGNVWSTRGGCCQSTCCCESVEITVVPVITSACVQSFTAPLASRERNCCKIDRLSCTPMYICSSAGPPMAPAVDEAQATCMQAFP